MKMVITGAAGFIGSEFLRQAIEKYPDDEIVVLDALTYAGNMNNFKGIEDKFTFIKGDIRNKEDVEKALVDSDLVVNFAAETHVDRSIQDAFPFMTTDIIGTATLLEAVRKFDVSKFVQISTDEVYGDIKEGSSVETDAFKPNSPYSASKAGAELMVRAYARTYGVKTLVTRSSNNYGPRQYPEKLIPLFVTNLLRGKKVPVYGDGSNIRDWLYVSDNCEGIWTVIEKGRIGEAYNIGGQCEKTNLEITHKILELLGKGEEMITHVEDRKGHDFRYSLDISKIKKLGWSPKTSFEEGMKKTVQWYKDNKWWWEPLLKN